MRGLAFIGEHLERDVFEGFPPCNKFYPQQTTVELIDLDINKIDLLNNFLCYFSRNEHLNVKLF